MIGVFIICSLHFAHIAEMFRFYKPGFAKIGCCAAIKPKPQCMVKPGFAIRTLMKEIKESEMRELVVAHHEILKNPMGTCCFAESGCGGRVFKDVERENNRVGDPIMSKVIYDRHAPIIGEDEEDYGEFYL
jgi:hypothetical protein